MPTIVHFEIPANEVDRAQAFYKALFDWKFEQFQGVDYWFITTSGDHPVNGGMLQKRSPQHPITNYIDVDSVEPYMSKVEQLGGKVVMQKTAVPGMGYFAICQDTEDNTFGLWQTDSTAK